MPLPLYRPPSSTAHSSLKIDSLKEEGPIWIAIAAGKGGVGKSTLTLQVARYLAESGKQVAILDADLYGPSMRHMLPEDALPGRKNGRLTPARCGGIGLISLAYFRPEQESIAVRAPIANQLISHFLKEVDWAGYEYVIVDFPPGTGDIQLSLCQHVRFAGAVLVTTPQLISLLDVRKSAHFFQQMKVPLLGVIENMSHFVDPVTETTHYLFGKEGGKQLADELGVPLLGQIPLSPALCQACDLGLSLAKEASLEGKIAQKACDVATARMLHVLKGEQKQESEHDMIQDIVFPQPGMITILWKDGTSNTHSLRALQQQCPCAGCMMKDQKNLTDRPSHEVLLVDRVSYMGHYGLRFDFQSGCRFGLYPLKTLRSP